MRTTPRPTALDLLLDALPEIDALLAQIKRRDRHLEDQIRRAVTRAALNLGEADGRSLGNLRCRLEEALGEIKEARVGLKVALGFRYVGASAVAPVDRVLDQVAAMTFRRLNPRC